MRDMVIRVTSLEREAVRYLSRSTGISTRVLMGGMLSTMISRREEVDMPLRVHMNAYRAARQAQLAQVEQQVLANQLEEALPF